MIYSSQNYEVKIKMTKEILKHEEKYFHIKKNSVYHLAVLPLWVIGGYWSWGCWFAGPMDIIAGVHATFANSPSALTLILAPIILFVSLLGLHAWISTK